MNAQTQAQALAPAQALAQALEQDNEFHPINVFAFKTAIQSSLNGIISSVINHISYLSSISRCRK